MFDVHSEFLFPRQVIISKDLEYETYKDQLVNYCLNKKIQNSVGEKYTNVNGWQSGEILYDENLPKVFKERILENVIFCLNKELKIKNSMNVKIHRMWIQISQKDSYNTIHNHPFSHYSGVFYVKSTNNYNCGTINFYPYSDANNYQHLLFVNEKILEKYNMKPSISYIPVEGMTMLFPSELKHSVSTNNTNTDRISIAFDVLFENYA